MYISQKHTHINYPVRGSSMEHLGLSSLSSRRAAFSRNYRARSRYYSVRHWGRLDYFPTSRGCLPLVDADSRFYERRCRHMDDDEIHGYSKETICATHTVVSFKMNCIPLEHGRVNVEIVEKETTGKGVMRLSFSNLSRTAHQFKRVQKKLAKED